MARNKIALSDDPQKAIIKAIAFDIGKEVVAYVERMYPQAVSATSSTFKLSLRNCIHNEIMAALEVTDETKVMERLRKRAKDRRELKIMWKNLRETDWEAYRAKQAAQH